MHEISDSINMHALKTLISQVTLYFSESLVRIGPTGIINTMSAMNIHLELSR